MDSLEQESSDLADRLIQVNLLFFFLYLIWLKIKLKVGFRIGKNTKIHDLIIQDQVTKAEEQERLVLSQEDLENARLAKIKFNIWLRFFI